MKRKRRPEPDEATAHSPRAARQRSDSPSSEASAGIADLAGPALRLTGFGARAPIDDVGTTDPARTGADDTAPPPALALRAPVGEEIRHTVFAGPRTVRLHGRTDATFDGGSSSITGQRTTRAEGCDNCTDGCLRVRGTLVLTYRVATTVTLPSVSDFTDLTPCQRARVAAAIRDVLAPHEQKHVRAFETYNGTTRTPFDLKGCNAEEISAQLQDIHDRQAAAREATAQALSDALDPFHFDVDLDCKDEEAASAPPEAPGPAAGADADDDEDAMA